MNNDLHIEVLLDELVKGNASHQFTETKLAETGDKNPVETISLHIAAVRAIKRYNVLQQVQQVHQTYTGSTPGQVPVRSIKPKFVKWVLGIAATLVLIFTGRFAYEYSSNSSSKLYSDIYQPYSVNAERGAGDVLENNQALITAFKAKDYQSVIKIYERLDKTGNREKFLAAYAYHQTGEYEKSADLCKLILNMNKTTNPQLYNDEAEFYAGLAYLKLKKLPEAYELFKAIYENPRHTFHERVTKRIIRRLNWLQ